MYNEEGRLLEVLQNAGKLITQTRREGLETAVVDVEWQASRIDSATV